MSSNPGPSPAPWEPVWTPNGMLMVISTGGTHAVAVAACDGDAAEANTALICAAPDMASAVRIGDLSAALAALTDRGLA